ncbi:MAG: hypothetical protein ACUVYA_17195 [Planctomycetota bacterium]
MRADTLGWAFFLGAFLSFGAARAAQPFSPPDFDLAISAPEILWIVDGSAVARFEATVRLRSAPSDPEEPVGAQAWTLSIAASGARIADASVAGTAGDAPPAGFYVDGFRMTLIVGPASEGAISAVALSFYTPATLPAEGEFALLRLALEAEVPAPGQGCREARIEFRDGLKGPGEPVLNAITYRGRTRRDDGSSEDSDRDREENASVSICVPFGFLRGDASPDAGVDISDAISTLSYLFLGGAEPPCIAACDVNDDENVNISDPIYLLSHLFTGGPEPPPPWWECGADPTPGRLPCGSPGC